jgi:hypothetical protein
MLSPATQKSIQLKSGRSDVTLVKINYNIYSHQYLNIIFLLILELHTLNKLII